MNKRAAKNKDRKRAAPVAIVAQPTGSLWPDANFAGTILISAFLLFQVQPLISKVILPWFGGTPAVWTTCLLFFQSVLFLGYAYAHFSERWLPRFAQTVLHLVLIVLAICVLPIMPGDAWKPTGTEMPTWYILKLLGSTVGLPFFVISATGPLLQAWFSRVYPDRSPYRLYALSNIGSLLALVSYPFIFEPTFNLQSQARYWTWGFWLFGGLCALAAVRAWRAPEASHGAATTANPSETHPEAAPHWSVHLLWLALAAFGSMMLLATTNNLCQDVAVVPFLWVAPLSLYLITFIVAFDHPRWYRRGSCAALTLISVAAVIYLAIYHDYGTISMGIEVVIHCAFLFLVCMLCHGELARLKPTPRYLTSYYLMIAAGGALGAVFVSIVAPLVFTTYYEWRMGVAGAILLASGLLISTYTNLRWRDPLTIGTVLGVLVALPTFDFIYDKVKKTNRVSVERNFFGVLTIRDAASGGASGRYQVLLSGSTPHGAQCLDERRNLPTLYYTPETGIGRTLGFYAARPNLRVGVVGLGCGTLAAYIKLPTQSICFYEINPAVERIARENFTYVKDCPGQVKIVLGDARLSLERELKADLRGHYTVLALDAFSADAIPAHLLTKEAFETYLQHLEPDGAIALHISNRFLDLVPVTEGLANHFKLQHLVLANSPTVRNHPFSSESRWVVLSRNSQLMATLRAGAMPDPETHRPPILWTDDHNNLLYLLKK